jgi:hypothetical protein
MQGAPAWQQKPPHWVGKLDGGQTQWSTSQTACGSQQSVPHLMPPLATQWVHAPFRQVSGAAQHSLPHNVPPEGQPHWSPLHVVGTQHCWLPHAGPVQVPLHGAHAWAAQHVLPQSMPRSSGQHALAWPASPVEHAGSLDGQPPPLHALTEPGGAVAAWPSTAQPVALHAEQVRPFGAQ